jgi:hypothetical protein
MRIRSIVVLALAGAGVVGGACSEQKAAQTGADVLQSKEPVDQITMHLVGLHPIKDDPTHAMVVHHFCSKLNDEVTQCVLFDGDGKHAKMNGIEYIISEELFDWLPKQERELWHPHNFELMSGMLVLPGVPSAVEHELLKPYLNSYGKTWHVWDTGAVGKVADSLPLAQPRLAWSFNAEGEAPPALVKGLEQKLDIRLEEKKRDRADLGGMLHCQEGVDANARFYPTRNVMPGICEKEAPEEGRPPPTTPAPQPPPK